ncbi:MAG: signal peptidase II [Lachnospiraceae bacterium]
MKQSFTMKRLFTFLAGMFGLILFDQWTKLLAVTHLKDQEPFVIIKGVFQLRYLENRGAAFGMLQGQQWFFIIMALVVLIFVSVFYFKLPWEKKYHCLRAIGLLICSGAVGNVIDRLLRNYVVDFFYFELIDFAIFNVADVYITVGTAVLAILILFYYKEEDLSCFFPGKKEKH